MPSTATAIDTDCKLLLHCDGVGASTSFPDSELNAAKTVTANGNAQVDTAQSKFGGASALFDGAGDYLSIPDSADWDLGAGDFTIDLWFRWNSTPAQPCILDLGGNANLAISWLNTGNIYVYFGFGAGGGVLQFSWTPSTNTWYHFAFVRSGTNVYCFIDGVQIGITETSSIDIQVSQQIQFGRDVAGNFNYFDGWMDEIRIVKGTAIWTANFTPPTAPYAVAGGGNFFPFF